MPVPLTNSGVLPTRYTDQEGATMIGFSGVLPDLSLLKKHLLLLDKLIYDAQTLHVVDGRRVVTGMQLRREADEEYTRWKVEAEWLSDRGVLESLQGLVTKKLLPPGALDLLKPVFHEIEPMLGALSLAEAADLFIPAYERKTASYLNQNGFEAVSVSSIDQFKASLFKSSLPTEEGNVVSIVLEKFPQPDELVDWERIIDFREDADGRMRRTELNQWMRKIAKGTPTIGEVRDELEILLGQYEEHMKLHNIKSKRGIVETTLTVTAEALENLAKFKLKDLVKLGFSFRTRKIDLLLEEHDAPGREVSYVAKVRREFKAS
jgi:hypothetical protein